MVRGSQIRFQSTLNTFPSETEMFFAGSFSRPLCVRAMCVCTSARPLLLRARELLSAPVSSARPAASLAPFPRLSLQLRRPTLPAPPLLPRGNALLLLCMRPCFFRAAPSPRACSDPGGCVAAAISQGLALGLVLPSAPRPATCTPHALLLACVPHHLRPPRREHRRRPGAQSRALPPSLP
jgi:hypothetical protein